MGNLHNYRKACQPRPCSPFRIGQVWRIWPATFDRCKNERTLHRAGAHAERGQLTDRQRDKKRERQTTCHCCCTTMRNCGRRASNVACSAHIELQLKSQLAAGRSLPQLMPHSPCLPAKCNTASAADNTDISGRQPLPSIAAMMQLLIRNSPAGLACLLRSLHTEKKQFVTHTHTQTKTILHLVEIQG